MKNVRFRLFSVFIAVAGLMTSPLMADLGLRQIAAEKGASAVGQAVLAAVRAVYAANTDPAVIQSQLVVILNEAAATGNDQAVRYSIVAVMMAGGSENLGLSKAAINNSAVFTSFETLTAQTVSAAENLMTQAGGATGGTTGGTSGGSQAGGNGETGGGDRGGQDKTLGGGTPGNPFNWSSLTGPGDNDLPATGV